MATPMSDFWDQFQTISAPGGPSNGGVTGPGGFQYQPLTGPSGGPIDNSGVSGMGTGGMTPGAPQQGGGGMMYPQVIVQGPNGWWKSSPDPNAPWHGPNGETLPIGQNPPGYPDAKSQFPGAGGNTPPQGGGGQITMQQFNNAWLSSPYPGTVDGLKQFMAAHPEYAAAGITLGGSKGDKVYGPGGAFWGDAVIAAGEGGKGKSGMTGPQTGGGAGGGSTLGSLGYAFGSSMAPWTEQFKAPDPNQILNDPYYKFQAAEGLRGIQNSAAAKGTLLTGGTLKGIEQYGQGLASSFGDKAYDRGMGEYMLRRDNFFQNQDRPFSKNVTLAQLGRPQ